MQIAADAARAGLEIIERRCAEIEAEIVELVSQRRALATAELEKQREAAIDRYVEAANALGPIVAELVAADRLIRKISPPDAVRTLPGEALLGRIRKERLPIPWNRSDRTPTPSRGAYGMQPGVWAAVEPYLEHAPILAAPDWMDNDALIDEAVEIAARGFRAAGLDV
ncbi:hypothetical protein [Paraburkholderia ribeironis]|uniref:hypothetical protein n=1 Tax=Paraburkholderia ribeironis TaxID=1247936 RepID=UPI000B9D5216|nr:hypothetical protein [Paraburkholderia ribeironis]